MDQREFTDLLEPHYADLLDYARALANDGDEADDILQDALLRALSGFDGLRDRARFRPWLFTIVTRVHASRSRGWWSRRRVSLVGEVEFPEVFRTRELPDLALDVLRALRELPQRQRSALLLSDLAGFSVREITEIQGDRSASAVKSRLSRARQRLRDLLDQPKGGHGAADRHVNGDLTDEALRVVAEAES